MTWLNVAEAAKQGIDVVRGNPPEARAGTQAAQTWLNVVEAARQGIDVVRGNPPAGRVGMITVPGPNGITVQFPDGMDSATIAHIMASYWGDPPPGSRYPSAKEITTAAIPQITPRPNSAKETKEITPYFIKPQAGAPAKEIRERDGDGAHGRGQGCCSLRALAAIEHGGNEEKPIQQRMILQWGGGETLPVSHDAKPTPAIVQWGGGDEPSAG
jgi:hypothetical protein